MHGIFFSIYFAYKIPYFNANKTIIYANNAYALNSIATLGDFFLLLHDWIFAEQYVAACLNLPIIIKIFEHDEKT